MWGAPKKDARGLGTTKASRHIPGQPAGKQGTREDPFLAPYGYD